MNLVNQDLAGRLEEVARLLHDQGADRYRVGAYLRAASCIRSMQTPVDEVLRDRGLDGLKQLPYVGESIARSIRELITHGRLPMLDRLRGEADPGLETLADLETAAHDGRLATVAGFGPKRLAGIRDSLAHRLGRVQVPMVQGDTPSLSELLDVDRE
jgi:DNA polymerase/3'-5' exonuclease PolX